MTASKGELPAGLTPRLLTREQVAAYLALSPNAFDELVQAGQMPVPLPLARADGRRMKVSRWDIRALDKALDALSGVTAESASDLRRRAAEKAMEEALNGRRGVPTDRRPSGS